MYNVKLYNKISKVGLDDLDAAKYTCSEDFENYDAVLVRSAKLHDVQFPADLKCIARAGAGVNNIPIDRWLAGGHRRIQHPGCECERRQGAGHLRTAARVPQGRSGRKLGKVPQGHAGHRPGR